MPMRQGKSAQTDSKPKPQHLNSSASGEALAHHADIRRIGRPLGLTRVAREIRRQEQTSDFTGYTENYSFGSLKDFLRSVGGPCWQLSIVPILFIKCWHTSTPLKEVLRIVRSEERGTHHERQIRKMASSLSRGRALPGIFWVKSEQPGVRHWILAGYRRLLAHRLAKATTIPVYHPCGLFDSKNITWLRPDRDRAGISGVEDR
jgi:hypothetical protein